MLQVFSAVGNVSAGLIWLLLVQAWSRHVIDRDWPWLFGVGIVPALLSIIVARRIHEPEIWLKAKRDADAGAKKVGSIAELFGDRRWATRAAAGLCLAVSGVVGLWGIGVFSNDLTQSFIGRQYDDRMREQGDDKADLNFVAAVIDRPDELAKAKSKVLPKDLLGRTATDIIPRKLYEQAIVLQDAGKTVSRDAVFSALMSDDPKRKLQPQGVSKSIVEYQGRLNIAEPIDVESHVTHILDRQRTRLVESRSWAAVTLAMFNVGGFFGIYLFARVTQWLGRRPTFALSFLAAGITTALTFHYMSKPSDVFWMTPLMGAAQLSVFGGYAIYFPELFPTRLRSTGMSFCYNVGRYVAATGPISIAFLKNEVFGGTTESFRYAGMTMCLCYVLGVVALLFAPETKGQPLPE
jgi:MFS family permease